MQVVEEGADLGVTTFLVISEETSVTAYTNYHGGLGYGSVRWGWAMGSSTTNYAENDYLEGTFVLSFYDQAQKSLVWQGTYQGVVKEKPQKREKSILKKMNKLMKAYPVEPMK